MSLKQATGIVLAIVIAGEAFADIVSRNGLGPAVLVALAISGGIYARVSNKQKR